MYFDMENISFEDFKKIDIRIGKIISAEKIEKSEKLLKLQVDFGFSLGEAQTKILQIVSGIAQSFSPESLVGKEYPFVVNMEPRELMGVKSQGMIMAVSVDGRPILMPPSQEVPPGSIVK
jgi:methionine--tRNA ligase beta chain